ncbi:MAG TPA: MBL fold metallo-hydrolase [Coleofasciculaceae cyanobacterium]
MSGFGFVTNHAHSLNGTLPTAAIERPSEFTVKFWGVRGSIPTSGIETARFGGNTPCVEMQVGGKRLVFDGGTGLRVLGKHLLCEMPVQAHIFFTHTHWDRIQGFPFFAPAFIEGNQFDVYGAIGANGASIKQRLSDQMLRPNFPVSIQAMRSQLRFHDVAPGSIIRLDDVVIETIALNRPNGALGYRVTWNGCAVVYATDTDPSLGHLDQGLLYLANQADLLIYDIARPDHIPYLQGSADGEQPLPWKTGAEVAIAAEAKQIALFHHDPDHEDDFLEQMEAELQAWLPKVQFAREGLAIQLFSKSSSVANG